MTLVILFSVLSEKICYAQFYCGSVYCYWDLILHFAVVKIYKL